MPLVVYRILHRHQHCTEQSIMMPIATHHRQPERRRRWPRVCEVNYIYLYNESS